MSYVGYSIKVPGTSYLCTSFNSKKAFIYSNTAGLF